MTILKSVNGYMRSLEVNRVPGMYAARNYLEARQASKVGRRLAFMGWSIGGAGLFYVGWHIGRLLARVWGGL